MSTVNERFFELRTALGLTQAELGDIIDIKKATISMIESGKANLSKRARLILLQTYNVNPDWLDNGNGSMFVEAIQKYGFKQAVNMTNDRMHKKEVMEIMAHRLSASGAIYGGFVITTSYF